MDAVELFMPMRFKGKNVSVHITTYGKNSKKQILCLHGFGSDGRDSFDNVAKYLSKDYQLIAIDWIGFGKTTRLLRKMDNYNHRYMSSFLEKFITIAIAKKILKKRFSIFAVSMSGLMTGMLYKRIEKYLESIIFLNPAGFDKEISAKFSVVMANPLLNQEKFLRIISKDIFWKQFLGLKDDQKTELFERFNNGEFDVFVRCVGNSVSITGRVKETHIYHKYHEITVPVLMIASKKDTMITEQEYLKTAAKNNWKIVQIEHYDHVLVDQKPTEVANAVKKFLR